MRTQAVSENGDRSLLDRASENARRKYDRAARYYDFQMWAMERMGMRRFRREALACVMGPRVLEVGVGTGINLPEYPADFDVEAIDLSPRMLTNARRRQDVRAQVRFHEMDVQHLEFATASFDSVLSTCVFCSVPRPVQGLLEIRRVLQPYGFAVFLEHVRPGGRLGTVFDSVDPIVSRAGPHINRRTIENIEAAGFTIQRERNLFSDILKLIVARP